MKVFVYFFFAFFFFLSLGTDSNDEMSSVMENDSNRDYPKSQKELADPEDFIKQARNLIDESDFQVALLKLDSAQMSITNSNEDSLIAVINLIRCLSFLELNNLNIVDSIIDKNRSIFELYSNTNCQFLQDYYSILAVNNIMKFKGKEASDFCIVGIAKADSLPFLKCQPLQLYLHASHAFGMINEHETALKYAKKARHLVEENPQTKSILKGNAYNNLAFVQIGLESYQKAVANLEKSLMFVDGKHNRATVLSNIAYVYSIMGKTEKAEEYYFKALQLRKAIFPSGHPIFSSSFNSLGYLFTSVGNYDEALYYHRKALDIRTKALGSRHMLTGYSLNNIGHAFLESSRYEDAIEYFIRAIEIFNSGGQSASGILGVAYDNLSLCYSHSGNYEKAFEANDRAKEIIMTNFGKDDLNHTQARVNSTLILNEAGRHSEALNDILRIEKENPQIFGNWNSNLRRPDLSVTALANLAHTYLKLGQLDSLISVKYRLAELLEFMSRANADQKTYNSYSEKAVTQVEGIIRDFERFEPNSERFTFSLSEKLKGRQLAEKIRQESYTTSFGLPDSLREKEYDLGIDIAYYEKKKFKEEYESKAPNDSLVNIYADRLFNLRRKRDDLQELLKTKHPNYYNVRYSQKVISISGVQDSLLEDNQALVEYFVGDSSIFTFTILPDTFYVQEIKKDFPLDQWVEDMLHGIYGKYSNSASKSEKYAYQESAYNIYEKVFLPLDTLLPENTEIIVVPDGILGYIPFDALITDSTQTDAYLIRDHEISYAYSATLQAEMKYMERDRRVKKRVLAFAPSFDQQEYAGDTLLLASRNIDISDQRNWLGPLEYNDDEVLAIDKLAEADLFLDSMATKAQFLKHAGDYSIVHLSTHGKANDKMGDYSFLAFSDNQDSSETWLYNRELYGLDLNADMVVLSACETGIGELQRGEGIISLARGFSYAGAKSIITTLWSVNDRSTQKLMELFYSNLKEGMHKDAALRKAKLDYLDNYPQLGADPYFWAGIIPIGDMSPIALSDTWPFYYWGFIGLILITLTLFLIRRSK